MNRYAVPLFLLFLVIWIGSRHCVYPPVPVDERPILTFTNWTDDHELFFQMNTLVLGSESPCVAFVTRLRPFSALTQGRVTMVLRSISGEERFDSQASSTPGIFHITAKPVLSGRRKLIVQIDAGALSETHDFGYVTVFESVAAARHAIPEEPTPSTLISFSKDQQWAIDFGTALVAERSVRPTLRASGILRARPDGEFVVKAPVAGRFASAGMPLLHLGEMVAENDLLGAIEPSVEAADLAASSEPAAPNKGATQRIAERQTVLLRAPHAGTVTASRAARGAFFEAGEKIARIIDLTQLWLEVHVPESGVAKLSVPWRASILAVGSEEPIDLPTESLIAHRPVGGQANARLLVFAVDNRSAGLRVGTSCNVFLVTGEARRAVAIPESSILDEGGIPVAYVQVKGESFERRVVRLGNYDSGFVEVLDGVKPGERVVTRGASSIKRSAPQDSTPSH